MTDSILETIKIALAITEDPDFDDELCIHINSALNALIQIGIGPKEGFIVTSSEETWADFLGSDNNPKTKQMAKSYVFMKTKLIFDSPNSSYLTEAIKSQIAEYEWRLQTQKEALDE